MTGPGVVETEGVTGGVTATSAAGAAGHSDSQIARGTMAGATGATNNLAASGDLPVSYATAVSEFQLPSQQGPTSSGFHPAGGITLSYEMPQQVVNAAMTRQIVGIRQAHRIPHPARSTWVQGCAFPPPSPLLSEGGHGGGS